VNHIRSLSMLSACVGTFALATVAAAQQATPAMKSNTEKLMLSVALGGTSIKSDEFENESESGGGFSLQAGWGFTRLFTLLVDASGAVLGDDDEEFVLVHFDLLGRLNFANPQRAWVPYVEGGISARVAGQDDIEIVDDGGSQEVDLEISGGGLTFGGGVQYHVRPTVALGAGIRWTVGEFSTVKINNVSVDGFELDATSTRLMFGVTWRPMSRRQ
jgi:opacity protein-like surface antigen